MRKDPFESARSAGIDAARQGKPITACPYRDIRKADGRLTFSRAWRNAWLEGWRYYTYPRRLDPA